MSGPDIDEAGEPISEEETDDTTDWAMACPFCGADEILLDELESEEGEDPQHFCSCGNCGADGPTASSEMEAGMKWNCRR